MHKGEARGQNLGQLKIFFAGLLLWNHLYLNNMYEFRVDIYSLTLDRRVQCSRVGLQV